MLYEGRVWIFFQIGHLAVFAQGKTIYEIAHVLRNFKIISSFVAQVLGTLGCLFNSQVLWARVLIV